MNRAATHSDSTILLVKLYRSHGYARMGSMTLWMKR
jgi:hypothetical protein